MYKNSAFAPTETFVMLLTAFLKNSESDFLIVVPNDIQVSSPVDSYVKSVGGQVVTIVEAKKLEKKGFPEHIWVHSFGKANVAKELIEHFSIEYSIYSDGLKNELGRPKIEECFPEYQSVLFFGFVWKKPFIKIAVPIRLCSFNDIVSAFHALKSIVGVQLFFTENDITRDFLFLRYWGQGPGEFVSELSYIDVIKNYLSLQNTSSVILKGDSRIRASSTDAVLDGLGKEFDVVAFDDRVTFKYFDSGKPDKFFAEVMIPGEFNGRLHCFDSSLSVYAAVATDATIQFPDEDFIKSVFANNDFASNAITYTNLYRSVCEKVKLLKSSLSFNDKAVLVVERAAGKFSVRETFYDVDDDFTIGNI